MSKQNSVPNVDHVVRLVETSRAVRSVRGTFRLLRNPFTSVSSAIVRAERLARTEGHIGAVAFSRTGDPGSGEFGDAVVLRSFGEVPSDLSAL
jgi:hypothetical protein